METDFTEQEIKTMFKVSKRLQQAFSGVKKLTTKFLLKVKKIKSQKAKAYIQKQERKKQQQIQKKKRQKNEARKSQKDKQKYQKQKEAQEQKKKQQEEKPLRSIYSIIRPEKSKPKQDKNAIQEAQQKKKGKGKQPEQEVEQKIIEKPIEPESPYFQFLRIKRNEIKASIPNAPMEQTSKIMRALWQNMTDEERRPFVQEYEAKKAKYERDMIAYYQQPKRNKIEAKKKDEERQKYLVDFDFVEELGRM